MDLVGTASRLADQHHASRAHVARQRATDCKSGEGQATLASSRNDLHVTCHACQHASPASWENYMQSLLCRTARSSYVLKLDLDLGLGVPPVGKEHH